MIPGGNLMLSYLLRFAVLFSFWCLLSGKMDAFHLTLGALSTFLVLRFTSPRHGSRVKGLDLARVSELTIRGSAYGFWLLGRIILAALHVSKLVLSPSLPVRPRLLRHKTPLKSDWARVIFANSITLTPGTITAELNNNELIIHALDGDSSGDIESGAMEKEIASIFPEERGAQ